MIWFDLIWFDLYIANAVTAVHQHSIVVATCSEKTKRKRKKKVGKRQNIEKDWILTYRRRETHFSLLYHLSINSNICTTLFYFILLYFILFYSSLICFGLKSHHNIFRWRLVSCFVFCMWCDAMWCDVVCHSASSSCLYSSRSSS